MSERWCTGIGEHEGHDWMSAWGRDSCPGHPLSVPVESREQPSGGFRGGQIPPYPQESASRLMAQLVVARSDLAAALATIRELRAEAGRLDEANDGLGRAVVEARAERDRARSLAAGLEEECAQLNATSAQAYDHNVRLVARSAEQAEEIERLTAEVASLTEDEAAAYEASREYASRYRTFLAERDAALDTVSGLRAEVEALKAGADVVLPPPPKRNAKTYVGHARQPTAEEWAEAYDEEDLP